MIVLTHRERGVHVLSSSSASEAQHKADIGRSCDRSLHNTSVVGVQHRVPVSSRLVDYTRFRHPVKARTARTDILFLGAVYKFSSYLLT